MKTWPMLTRGMQPRTKGNCLMLSCCLKVMKSSKANKKKLFQRNCQEPPKVRNEPVGSVILLYLSQCGCDWCSPANVCCEQTEATDGKHVYLLLMRQTSAASTSRWWWCSMRGARTSQFLNAHSAGVSLNDRSLARCARKHFFSFCKWSTSHTADCGGTWTSISRIT